MYGQGGAIPKRQLKMGKQYDLDIEKLSLQKFKKSLQQRDLAPSRVILKDNIENRFKTLDLNGVRTLKTLVDVLKTKQKIENFSKKANLSVDYLTILGREARSYLPKPINLKQFPGIDPKTIKSLEQVGIKNTKQFYNRVTFAKQANQISKMSGVSTKNIGELSSLSDLTRLYGVGPVFAIMLNNVGINSVERFAKCTAAELIELYENETQKKADFSEKDMNFSLYLAKQLIEVTE